MQEKYLFEYAVIRVVPRVEREEFINVGVVLYCAGLKYLKMIFEVNHERLQALAPDMDCAEIKAHLQAFEQICTGGKENGPIGQLDIASRFRWLTATRSTMVQTSKVHPGFCTDANATLLRLHRQLVL
ncbi:DUF3037 domain-containing protein [Pedobacter sp. BS3]|uniref:DUF3037 domain-containing protein n=1 Tax=Pedobacter sp. BS3 TaxID=2567937 RepID=UPI0011EF3692|nr:DUF3037 domain-containing protein [Pedobacter sp. BS3]TZF83988.1 DUF3037 domain-containing protein [Pedobacter sp. BS3]